MIWLIIHFSNMLVLTAWKRFTCCVFIVGITFDIKPQNHRGFYSNLRAKKYPITCLKYRYFYPIRL